VALTYYLDESGSTGDLVRAGALGFEQPVFVLACVGLDDLADLESEIRRLRSLHRVQSAELKSTVVRDKPAFVGDLLDYLHRQHAPVLIEVVDKKFLFCVNLVNQLILPPVGAVDLKPESMFIRNVFADYLHAHLPQPAMQAYAVACDACSAESIRRVYEALSMWLERRPGDDITEALRHAVGESRTDFETAVQEGEGLGFGLPIPDQSKTNKPFWMLPNLSSFTNIYARINLLHERAVEGITLVHDEQAQFDRILEGGKITTEKLLGLGAHLSLAHSDYGFEQKADLEFRRSAECVGIQVADVLAGFIMRFVQSHLAGDSPVDPRYSETFRFLLTFSDPRRGTGINFMLTNRDVDRLGIQATPSYLPLRH